MYEEGGTSEVSAAEKSAAVEGPGSKAEAVVVNGASAAAVRRGFMGVFGTLDMQKTVGVGMGDELTPVTLETRVSLPLPFAIGLRGAPSESVASNFTSLSESRCTCLLRCRSKIFVAAW